MFLWRSITRGTTSNSRVALLTHSKCKTNVIVSLAGRRTSRGGRELPRLNGNKFSATGFDHCFRCEHPPTLHLSRSTHPPTAPSQYQHSFLMPRKAFLMQQLQDT